MPQSFNQSLSSYPRYLGFEKQPVIWNKRKNNVTVNWIIVDSISSEKYEWKTLILDWLIKKSLFDRFLNKSEKIRENPEVVISCEKGRENFGVQQFPLFSLLEPEELDWQVCLSRLEGKRRLDTRVPEKFALVKA